MATLKGFADLAAKTARDRQAFIGQTTKLARSFEPPAPEIPDIAMPEITPLAEQIADLLKPPQGTPGHTIETRGRKPKWDWEACLVELCGVVYAEGLPETQEELIQRMQQWFVDQYDDHPVRSQIQKRVRLVWQRIKSQA